MRSKHVTLTLVPLLLTACAQDNTLHQDVYNNQYDCVRDWNLELCTADSTSSGVGYVGTYLGPQYYKNTRKVKILRNGKQQRAYGNRSTGSKISQSLLQNARSTPIRGGFGGGSGSGGG